MAIKTEAQKRAQKKYMEGVAAIVLRTTPEKRERINAFAAAHGKSVNIWINDLIDAAMAKEEDQAE